MGGWPVVTALVPSGDEGLVEGTEKVDEKNEAVEVMGIRVRRIVCQRGQVDGGLQRQWPVALQRICSDNGRSQSCALPSTVLIRDISYLSVTKSSQ